MTNLQIEFLRELKHKEKLTIEEYVVLYNKYSELAMEEETKNGASIPRAKTMSHYYMISILSDFIGNENILTQIIDLQESK